MRWVRRVLALLAVIGVALLVWAIWDHEAWIAWMQRARPLPFFAVMALLPALGVPTTPLFVLAGATFGTWIGVAGSLVALGANLALCYGLARGLRVWMRALLRRFRYELPNLRERGGRAARFTIAVKLAPGVPSFVKHYGLGVAGVPFLVYFGLSMLITGTYAVLLVVLGRSLLAHRIGPTVWVVVAAIVLAALVWWWRRRSRARA
jgi:uncharacterized membrane protein YdjX (TVP38/TMEM64 family)